MVGSSPDEHQALTDLVKSGGPLMPLNKEFVISTLVSFKENSNYLLFVPPGIMNLEAVHRLHYLFLQLSGLSARIREVSVRYRLLDNNHYTVHQ